MTKPCGAPCGPTKTTARVMRRCMSGRTRPVTAGCATALAPTGACWRCRPPLAAFSCAACLAGRHSAPPTLLHCSMPCCLLLGPAACCICLPCPATACMRITSGMPMCAPSAWHRAGAETASLRPSPPRVCRATRAVAQRSTSKKPLTTPAGAPRSACLWRASWAKPA